MWLKYETAKPLTVNGAENKQKKTVNIYKESDQKDQENK